jgi:hypothetical protein
MSTSCPQSSVASNPKSPDNPPVCWMDLTMIDKILTRRLEALQKAATERPEPTHLPIDWPEPLRGAPNSVLRSALFGIVMRGRRRYLNKEAIASWSGVEIIYTGLKLDQSDLDVWLLAVHLARHQPLGSPIRFSAYSFLKGIERPIGKSGRDWLKSVFTRLTACAVEIKIGSRSYTGSLVHEFFYDADVQKYVLVVNPRLAVLFDDGYSLLEASVRNTLTTDLTKWLYSFIRSHAPNRIHRVGVENLISLCASETKHIRDFRRRLAHAMNELSSIGEVERWCFTKNGALEFLRPLRNPGLTEKN